MSKSMKNNIHDKIIYEIDKENNKNKIKLLFTCCFCKNICFVSLIFCPFGFIQTRFKNELKRV